jgi:type I site-specific restriction-modification system R (restriction) subunit
MHSPIIRQITICLLCLLCFQVVISAQTSGQRKVYKDNFIELHKKVNRYFQATCSDSSQIQTREELFTLTKLVHRLEEEASKSDTELPKNDLETSKTLNLISQGCIVLDFTIQALSEYFAKKDRSFLGLAKDGNALVNNIEKLLL